MTQYDRGRALEYRVRDLLVQAGFLVVRSAGSKSPVDLLALPRQSSPIWDAGSSALRCPWLVQAKRGGVLGPGEWNTLVSEALSVSAVPVMARYTPRQPIEFFRLLAPKVGRGRQPMELINFDALLTTAQTPVTME